MVTLSDKNQRYITELQQLLAVPTPHDSTIYEAIVNAPFHDRMHTTHMGLGIVVLTMVNRATHTIDRVALSATDQAKGAVRMTSKPFHDIKIPLDYTANLLVQVVNDGHWHQTTDWQYLFIPELSPREARFNQAGAGIECSVVYPLLGARDGGALIFSYFEPPSAVGGEQHEFMQAYAQMAARALGTTKSINA